MKTAAILLAVPSLFFPPLMGQPSYPPKRLSCEKAYEAGKNAFYMVLEERADLVRLEEEDGKRIKNAQRRIPGLYELLLNFYFFKENGNPETCAVAPDLEELTASMAGEFLDSIPPARIHRDESPLESILFSIGFHARKGTPQFRKFMRPLARQAKSQWMLKELGIREAHAITKGKGVRIAIIDSGIDPTIKELKSQIGDWKNFLDGSSPFGDGGTFPYDWGGHGTSVATVVSQIGPDVELMVVKVFDQETMSRAPFSRWNVYQIAAGINWAAKNGADVISLSVALEQNFREIRAASKRCWDSNVVLISAAGNVDGDHAERNAYYPAAYPWTIAVGGIEKKRGQLKVWEHSAHGNYIDVVAPAKEILVESPSYLDRRSWPARVSGNSLAVPVVAATAALVLSTMDSDRKRAEKITPGALVEAVRRILREGSSNQKLGYHKPNPLSGFGLINAYRSVERTLALNKELPSLSRSQKRTSSLTSSSAN